MGTSLIRYQVSLLLVLNKWNSGSDTENVCPRILQVMSKTRRYRNDCKERLKTPPSAGIYWYGIHVVDINDDWSDEGRPVKITVEETTPSPAEFAIGDIISSTVDDLK